MLTAVKIRGFKSIGARPIELDLRPLTVLVGENGAGKSTILEALAVLAQTALTRKGGPGYALHGPWVSFKPLDLAYHKRSPSHAMGLGATCEITEDQAAAAHQELQRSGLETATVSPELQRLLASGPHRIGFESVVSPSNGNVQRKLLLEGYPLVDARNERAVLHVGGDASLTSSAHPQSAGPQWFRHLSAKPGVPEGQEAWLTPISKLAGILCDQLRRVQYLSAQRGGQWIAAAEEVGSDPANPTVGRHGESSLKMLAYAAGPDGDEDGWTRIRRWAERFGMGRALAGLSLQGRVSFGFSDPELDVKLDWRAAGMGSQQVLPLLALLFATRTESTLLIEEPEVSLHPQGQLDVVDMLAEAVTKGRQQVIISTHSSLIVMGLRKAIQRGLISAQQVSVVEVRKDAEGTLTHPLELSDRGVIAGWIPSFAKVEDGLWQGWFDEVDEAAAADEPDA